MKFHNFEKAMRKSHSRSYGDRSVDEAFAHKPTYLSSNHQCLYKNVSTTVCACDPYSGEAEAGRCLGINVQQV